MGFCDSQTPADKHPVRPAIKTHPVTFYPSKALFRNLIIGCKVSNASEVFFAKSFEIRSASLISLIASQLLSLRYSAAGLAFSNPCGTLVFL